MAAASTARLLTAVCLLACACMTQLHASGATSAPASAQIGVRESIFHALRNNKGLQRAQLTHSLKDWPSRLAESDFVPRLRLRSGFDASRQGAANDRASTAGAVVGADVDMLLPTGARISIGATETASGLLAGGNARERLTTLQLTQPLLRGAGSEVTLAPLESAKMSGQAATLSLRDTTADLVTRVIRAHRTLVLANQQLGIAQRSLERSRQKLRTSEMLVEAGRQAAFELTQARSDVAQREFDASGVQLAYVNARAALASLTGLPRESDWSLAQEPIADAAPETDWLALAYANRTDWKAAALALRGAQLNLVLASNAKLPALDLVARRSLSRSITGPGTATATAPAIGLQLTLDLPVNDVGRDQAFASAKVALEQARLSQEEVAENLRMDVTNARDQVRSMRQQVELARSALKLAEQQLKNESLRFSEGRSTAFQVKQVEDALVGAEASLATTETGYLNALLDLDRAAGLTLRRWAMNE